MAKKRELLLNSLSRFARKKIGFRFGLLLSIVTGAVSLTAAAEPSFKVEKTPEGIEFGLWGNHDAKKAPTLFVLSGDFRETLSSGYFRQCGNDLVKLGYRCVSIDLPAHGALAKDPGKSGLTGWRRLAERGTDFVGENNRRLAIVLDHLISTGRTDPKQVAICGTSRGGFLAMHFAAFDDRVGAVAAFAPVTDLLMLREFGGAEENEIVNQYRFTELANRLAGRPVWIVIGDQDQRVGTDAAIAAARAITRASLERNVTSRVTLHVLPEPRGHTTPKGSVALAATWIRAQFDSIHSPDG